MPSNIVDLPVFTDPVVVPADGDPLNAASVIAALQGLANRTLWLRSLLTRNWENISAALVKTDAANDRWIAHSVGVGASLNRQVLIGRNLGTPIVYFRLGSGVFTVASAYSGSGDQYEDIANGAGLFVAITDTGDFETSPTGDTWTDRGQIVAGWANPHGIHFDGTDFVAVAELGRAAASNDGLSFGSVLNLGGGDFRDVYGSGSFWVIVGDAGRLYSIDDPYGAWVSRTSQFGANNILGVVYDPVNARWCAVGDNGVVSTSVDGITWALGDIADVLGTANLVACETDGAGTILTTSDTGSLFASYDGGVTWADHTMHPKIADDFLAQGLAWSSVDHCWYHLGQLIGGVGGALLRSLVGD